MDTAPASTDNATASARNLTLAVYILQAVGLIVAFTPLVGVIINHVKLADVRGTVYESHFRWQIRTFWWGLFWIIAGSLLLPVMGVGFAVLTGATIWFLYRVVRGFLNWNDHRAMPAAGA